MKWVLLIAAAVIVMIAVACVELAVYRECQRTHPNWYCLAGGK